MLMSDEEVEARLNSDKNLVRVIEKSRGGKTAGSTNIPDSVRDLIAITGGKQKEIAEEFGVDASSVSEIKKGMVGGRLDKDLQEVSKVAKSQREDDRNQREDDAHEAAMDVLMTSLTSLQPKLLDPELKPKDLSKIASDMAKVASVMKPRDNGPSTVNNTQVILYAPPKKDLSKYEFIEG